MKEVETESLRAYRDHSSSFNITFFKHIKENEMLVIADVVIRTMASHT